MAVERGELAPGRGGMRSGCERERASTWLVGRARIAGAPGKAPQARSPRERGEGRNREFRVPLAGGLAILASARPRQARRLAVSLPPTRSGGFSRPAAAQENVQKLILPKVPEPAVRDEEASRDGGRINSCANLREPARAVFAAVGGEEGGGFRGSRLSRGG